MNNTRGNGNLRVFEVDIRKNIKQIYKQMEAFVSIVFLPLLPVTSDDQPLLPPLLPNFLIDNPGYE